MSVKSLFSHFRVEKKYALALLLQKRMGKNAKCTVKSMERQWVDGRRGYIFPVENTVIKNSIR